MAVSALHGVLDALLAETFAPEDVDQPAGGADRLGR
jgi:hypothetical protein